MQKTLLVYYSLSGNTKKIAEEMARIGGWDVGVIKDASPRKGTWGYMRSALETVFKINPSIDYMGNDPAVYETVVLGSPIWVGRSASPIRSFAHQYKGKLKSIACFCTMGGTDSKMWQGQLYSIFSQEPKQLLALQDHEATSASGREKMNLFVNSINSRLRIAA